MARNRCLKMVLPIVLGTMMNQEAPPDPEAGDTNSYDASGKETNCYGLCMKPDGTKLFLIGYTSDKAHQWNLSTANSLNGSSISYHGYISTSSQSGAQGGIHITDNGLHMYTADQSGDEVEHYTLSTAWDVTSATHTDVLDVSAKESTVNDVFVKADGTELYIIGSTQDDTHQYTMSTAYDLDSATFTRTLDTTGQSNFPMGIVFKPDGTKMYICSAQNDKIVQYDLSTAWDISSASFTDDSGSGSLSSEEALPREFCIGENGVYCYMTGSNSDTIWAYKMTTAWDITTLVQVQ